MHNLVFPESYIMKTKTTLKLLQATCVILLFSTLPLVAQVGVGTKDPNAGSMLDIVSSNKGILIPRVSLTATTDVTTITPSATLGLLVFNIATEGTGETAVTEGFYYWNGSIWVRIQDTDVDWKIGGNNNIVNGVNFLGTTNDRDLRFRTNNVERMRIVSDGNVGINHNTYTNAGLTVNIGSNDFGIVSEGATGGGTASIYGFNTNAGYGVRGHSTNSMGILGTSTNNHGVYGETAFTGGAFLTGGIVGWGAGNNGANGVLAIADQNAASSSNIAIRAVSGSTTSISSAEVLNVAVNANATDLGLYVMTERPINNNTSISTEAARFHSNFTGVATDADARDPRARLAGYEPSVSISGQGTQNTYYGGYFYSGGHNTNSSYAYVGARRATTNFKIIGTGTVSTIVSGINPNEKKTMFAPEAPEVLFQDYGTGQLVNGVAQIQIDPIFSRNIYVSNEKPLKVFIQLEGDCNGVFVTNKSATGFTVKELQGGTSNASFSWHIVANRADEMHDGEQTVYQSLRFPDAPLKIEETPQIAQMANNERQETPQLQTKSQQ